MKEKLKAESAGKQEGPWVFPEERPEGKDTKGHQQEGAGGSGKEWEGEKSRWRKRHSWPREQRGKSRKRRARQRKGLEGEREEVGSGEVQITENLREAERGRRGMQSSEGGTITERGWRGDKKRYRGDGEKIETRKLRNWEFTSTVKRGWYMERGWERVGNMEAETDGGRNWDRVLKGHLLQDDLLINVYMQRSSLFTEFPQSHTRSFTVSLLLFSSNYLLISLVKYTLAFGLFKWVV